MAKVKKSTKDLSLVKIYIKATFNNTLITITDAKGDTLAWASSGAMGFKGARKSTPYAATTAVEAAVKKATAYGIRNAEVYIKGPGSGREAAIRALRSSGLNIKVIADVTPIPHNGPRPRKKRRV
ncbi:30S ribosomal protein S11 [Patescibacteria group bacterium]|nr:30S ribosomal protein S11 [Patescibacteria group bacterium]